MSRRKTLSSLLLPLLIFLFVAPPFPDGPHFEISELTIITKSGSHTFAIEVADSPSKRSRGLQNRTDLPLDSGMLFDFGNTRPVAMWMKNTSISLDILFIDAGGSVVWIAENTTPLSFKKINPPMPVRAALELAGGAAARLGIHPGAQVVHEMFSTVAWSRW